MLFVSSLGETCSHVAAVLFKVEIAVRLGLISKACNDVPCQWNHNLTKDVNPAPIAQIQFYGKKAKSKLKKSEDLLFIEPPAENEHIEFLSKLSAEKEKIVGLSLFADFQNPFIPAEKPHESSKLPNNLRNIYMLQYSELNQAQFEARANSIIELMSEVTLDETQYLEEVTRGQSSSITWHEHQSGWITSSIVHEAAKASLKNPANSLVLQITKPNFKMLNTPSLLWGREKEEIARDEYCNVISDPF